MDLIKEIRDISSEIETLKKSIANYDKQISQSEAASAKLNKMFAGAKVANVAALSIEELSRSINGLRAGYGQLTSAQTAYQEKESSMLTMISKLTLQNEKLAIAQRQALTSGDQEGAQQIYQRYISNSQAIHQYMLDLQDTRLALDALNNKAKEAGITMSHYAEVQKATKAVSSTKDIGALKKMYDDEIKKITEINAKIDEYALKHLNLSKSIKNGKLTPEQMDRKTMELEDYKEKLKELAEAYSVAAQRARIFANASGSNGGVPAMTHAMPAVAEKNINFPDIDEKVGSLAGKAKEASVGLENILLSGTLIGGLTFGAGQMADFARQVMAVRGEFQQLEVAFTTLLGSEQKAAKLMQQLTKTAATTPFDLQSVSRGAKQLLAYGTAADEVNDILIHLGDIAAGLSQPLDALVYLYGTTMVQGRMMTMDLRQFQNRGIPIAEQLAKQFGVAKSEVQGLVSAGRVTAEEFHKAVMAMSSDGGKFGGLMAAQAKTITGQISNIQDSISMMFNDIGKKSEGGINLMLEGVSSLVENYEVIGKTLLALTATIGVYKAALVVVAAVEKARAITALYNLANTGANITTTKLYTTALKEYIATQWAANKAMLANPAFLITAGIVAMGVAIWGLCRALDTQARAQDAVNKVNKESKTKLDDIKQNADEALSTIQSETASVYEKAVAYEKLKKILPTLTEQYSLQELETMKLADAQKQLSNAYTDAEFSMKKQQIEEVKQKIKEETPAKNSSLTALAINEIEVARLKEELAILEKQLADMEKLREKAEFDAQPKEVKIAKFTADIEGFKQDLEVKKKQLEPIIKQAQLEWNKKTESMRIWLYGTNDFNAALGKNPLGVAGQEYLEISYAISSLLENISSAQSELDALNSGTSKNISTIITEIENAEITLDAARARYSANMSEENKKSLTLAEANLKDKTELYQKATGKQWTATKDYNKQVVELEKQTEKQRNDILSREYSKRTKLAIKYRQDVESLDKEEREWRERNPNRGLPKVFSEKRAILELEYKTNIREVEQEFNEFVQKIERESVDIRIETKLNELEREVELSTNAAESEEAKKKVFEEQLRIKKEQLKLEKIDAIKAAGVPKQMPALYKSSAIMDAYTEYQSEIAKGNKPDAETYAKRLRENEEVKALFAESPTEFGDIENLNGNYFNNIVDSFEKINVIENAFEEKVSAIMNNLYSQQNDEELKRKLSDYEEYVQGMLDAETAYQQDLANIRASYGLEEDANLARQTNPKIKKEVAAVTKTRDIAVSRIEEKTGITKDKSLGDDLAALAGTIVGKTKTQVGAVYDDFIKKIRSQIAQAQKDLEGLGDGDISAKKQELSDTISSNRAQVDIYKAQNPNATQEEIEELSAYQEMIAAEEQLVDLLNQEVLSRANLESLQRLLIVAEQERGKAVSNASTTQDKANNKAEKTMTKQLNSYQKLRTALADIRDAADSIADVFGGSLSKDGKKAIETISSIADVGTSAVEGIMTVVEGVSDGMIKTTEGASTAMQNLEKASFILTIISMAVQLIMKIVEIAQKFSTSNQLQEQVDAHLEQLERLKKAQQLVEAQYKTAQGSKYYEGLVSDGEEYLKVLNKTRQALAAAELKHTYDENKYGEGSEKAKEAAAQVEDLRIEEQEAENDWILHYREMMEELSGTSLDSFAENLADALIEGFEMGKEGIDEVWEDTIDDILKTMMRNELALAIKDLFSDAFKKFTNKTSDGDLSQEDMEYFIDQLNAGKEKAKEIAEAYYNAMSEAGLLEDADTEGSEGFGQMTQDQADALTGRFTAVQIEMSNVSAATQAMANVVTLIGEDVKLAVASLQSLLFNSNIGLQMAQDQLDQLQVIADNTAMLAETNNRLKGIEQNTSRL